MNKMLNLQESLNIFEATRLKQNIPDVRPGETVKVHYKIREGSKERIQIFEGLVIGTKATKSYQGSFTVRKVVDGVGVERTFPLHSPWVTKVERVKSGKVRRAKLNFVRAHALSRRFKLKDKGIEGTVWDEPASQPSVEELSAVSNQPTAGAGIDAESREPKADSPDDIAQTPESDENVKDELSGEGTRGEDGNLGEPVSGEQKVPDSETKL